MYPEIYMDILNKCNARCKYCLTGQANRTGYSNRFPTYYMDVPTFGRLADHMLECGIMEPHALFHLYNWYEPTLNPHLAGILNDMRERELRVDLSTNAGRCMDFTGLGDCGHVESLLFSMPGFSQASYDRIHGFRLETVLENIRTTMAEFRRRGFHGDAYINFHLYQFNLGEIYDAKAFADSVGLRFHSIFAYFNGSGEFEPYLRGTLSAEAMKDATREIFFGHLYELEAHAEEYLERFAEPESITLSEFCNVIPGRGSNDESRVCSIFDLHSYEEVKAVYDNLASRPRDAALSRQIYLWAHSYKLSMNHLFGIPD
ncbi:MAG TPA: hypothetical protein H9714_07625 [Candidatus Flavonifractor intestinipullorum]|uniref:Radical SAM protein n=1 Tax=Candidatus Flavonifractor intestinipullorum TaxID=2838587 RepID=A0A9D2S616_9FIRM|nr:hypothetical protein [Candidatus Flavonifractor intestinipullorum]